MAQKSATGSGQRPDSTEYQREYSGPRPQQSFLKWRTYEDPQAFRQQMALLR